MPDVLMIVAMATGFLFWAKYVEGESKEESEGWGDELLNLAV